MDFLKQAVFYESPRRLEVAKSMEIAAIHNIRAVLKKYKQNHDSELDDVIACLSGIMESMEIAGNIRQLMVYEAVARQSYYQAFNVILKDSEFRFVKRSKRPPRDELNAMISFGNTLLYNTVLQAIWKTTLDPRIGIVHATTDRNYSLNLDFADLFKPLIVDRVIFSVINLGQIKKDEHFSKDASGAVYLNKEGKRIFVSCFEEKLSARINVQGQSYTYRQLIMRDIRAFQRYIRDGEKYKPYKYW